MNCLYQHLRQGGCAPLPMENGGVCLAKLISFDSKAAQLLSRIWDLLLLNLLFVLGSLPIITFGASAIAAYSVALKIVEDRDDSIIPAYFRAFRENLRQGIILTIALALAAAAVAADFILFEIIDGNPIIFLFLGFLCAGLALVHFFYVFPLAARYRNSVYRHLANSRAVFTRFYLRSLLCSVLVAFEVWLFFFNDWLLLFVGVFIAPILIIATISAFSIRFFRTIETESAEKMQGESRQDEKADEAESGIT
jgi:uncharacterized membrane protein YesL